MSGRRGGSPSGRRGAPQGRGGQGRGAPQGRGRGGQARQEPRRSLAAERGLGGEQVEGRRAVYELLVADRRRVREVLLAEGVDDNELIGEIEELCLERRIPIRNVSRARLDQAARSDAPQGVVAFASPLPELDIEELLEQDHPFLLAFDGVTDPHNLGALIRTGECAGVTGVVIPRHRAAHVTPTVAKASAGAVEHMPIAVVPGLPAALSTCKERGVWTVGLDPEGDVDIRDLAVADQPVVLVLGAEGSGLSRLTKQRCDVLARIPQYGSVASLNVSAAGAIACFEVARRRDASLEV